jgi:cytochrome oxidase Cu insertion factor (SCO1/SenC/PrrC family)
VRRPAIGAVVLAAAIAAISVAALGRSDKQARLGVGGRAPALAADAVRGGRITLDRVRGHVVLLSFLSSQAEATAAGDPSRAQIVFLRSMRRQHARFGLRVIVVDASELAGARRPSRNDLVNYTYDWDLDRTIAVVGDDGSFARSYDVDEAPTTFLVGPDGVVRERWDGFAPAARLDLAIRRAEGRSPTE